MAHVELRHLRALVALASCGTHTAAAESLYVTQPTLSRTVRQLEQILGTRLVEAGSARLTDDGFAVVERGRQVLAELEALEHDLSSAGSVRLGFAWLLPDPWFPTMRSELAKANVEVQIRRTDDPVDRLIVGDVDVALHRNALTPPPRGITTRKIFQERRVLAISRHSDELPDAHEVAWGQLPARPLVVNTVSGTTRADSLPTADRRRDIVTCHNFDEWIELVAADAGIGVVPEICARRVQHADVRYLAIPDAPPTHVRLAWRTNPSRPARLFIETASELSHSPGMRV
jgi:DNA-binding transcriptional LysR family regulator